MRVENQRKSGARSKNTPGDAGGLKRLGDVLTVEGFGEFTACFNPLKPAGIPWESALSSAPPRLRPMLHLFLTNGSVCPAELPASLRDLVPHLLELGILILETDGQIRTPGLMLIPVMGNWLFCQRPQPNPLLYFGDDSMALLTRMLPRTGGESLDLCAGPGLHAMHLGRFSRTVMAVEIDAAAAQLAVFNAALNRLSEKISVFQGDLFQPVAGLKFDTIAANPPLLPYPDRLAPPKVGNAGPDGLNIHRRIFAGLPQALKKHGHAHLIGLSFSDGQRLRVHEELECLAGELGLDICLSMLAHHPLNRADRFFKALVHSLAVISGVREDEAVEAFLDLVQQKEATHLCPFFIHAALGSGRFELAGVRKGPSGSFWFA